MMAGIGHNSKPTRGEVEMAFRERTRIDRIKDHTPFDIKWQWELVLSELPGNAKFIGLVLRLYQNGARDCSPSIDSLVHLTGLSKPTVIANLKLLERAIFVSIERGKGRAPSTYQMRIPEQTYDELAAVIDIRSGKAIEPKAASSGKAILPEADSVAVKPFNHYARSGKVDERSGKTILPDITRDITTTQKNSASACAKAAAVGIAAAMGALPAAASSRPPEPPAIVQPAKPSLADLTERMLDAGGKALANPAGAMGLLTFSELQRWLADGCDFETDILQTIRAKAGMQPPGSIKSWRYFTNAVAEAKAARTAPMPEVRGPPGAAPKNWHQEQDELQAIYQAMKAKRNG